MSLKKENKIMASPQIIQGRQKSNNMSKLGTALLQGLIDKKKMEQEQASLESEREFEKQSDIRKALLRGITLGTLQPKAGADLTGNLNIADFIQVPNAATQKSITPSDLQAIATMQKTPNVRGYTPAEQQYLGQFQGAGQSLPVDYAMKGGTGLAELVQRYQTTDNEDELAAIEDMLMKLGVEFE